MYIYWGCNGESMVNLISRMASMKYETLLPSILIVLEESFLKMCTKVLILCNFTHNASPLVRHQQLSVHVINDPY